MNGEEKPCTGCSKIKPLTDFGAVHGKATARCKRCLADYVNEYYRTHPRAAERKREYSRRWEKNNREKRIRIAREQWKKHAAKNKTRRRTTQLVISGKLIKTPCELCGELRVEAHHLDYSDAYKVRWLCPVHHREVEGRSYAL